jgi:hypothetical protein
MPIKYDKNLLGDVLANYEYNGIGAVDLYLYDLDPESKGVTVWPEGSQCLPANSPEDLNNDSTSENGESDE